LIIANLQGMVTKSELHRSPVNSIHWFIATFEIRRKPVFWKPERIQVSVPDILLK